MAGDTLGRGSQGEKKITTKHKKKTIFDAPPPTEKSGGPASRAEVQRETAGPRCSRRALQTRLSKPAEFQMLARDGLYDWVIRLAGHPPGASHRLGAFPSSSAFDLPAYLRTCC